MADVLRSFDEPIEHGTDHYHARVVGRLAEDGMWEGWLEFEPVEPGEAGKESIVVSAVESRQPELEHLQYWADGLSWVYVEGSLERALHPITVRTRVAETAVSSAPSKRIVTRPVYRGPEPVLDPFEVGGRSLDILSQELRALDRPRLLNIVAAYGLNPGGRELAGMTDAQLGTFIVVAVEAQLALRSR
jgi:hypothetical protein